MAVPVPPYNADNSIPRHSVPIADLSSRIEPEGGYTEQEELHYSEENFYRPNENKTSYSDTFTDMKSMTRKKGMEKNSHQPTQGWMKYLSKYLSKRKKPKKQEKVNISSSKPLEKGKKKGKKPFTMKCLQGEETTQESEKSEIVNTAVLDETEHSRSVNIPITMVTQDNTWGSKQSCVATDNLCEIEKDRSFTIPETIVIEDFAPAVENEGILTRLDVENFLPLETNWNGHEDDGFRDIRCFKLLDSDLGLLSLLDDSNLVVFGEISDTVEADRLGYDKSFEKSDVEEDKGDEKDDDSAETMMKEVVPCKQSAKVLTRKLVPETKAVQCTESNEGYHAMQTSEARGTSKRPWISEEDPDKDDPIDFDTKHTVLRKLSHTEPVISAVLVSTDQKGGQLDLGNTEETSYLSEIGNMDKDVHGDKLKFHKWRIKTEESHHRSTTCVGEYVFQKQNKASMKNDSTTSLELQPMTGTSCYCTFGCSATVGYCSSVEEPIQYARKPTILSATKPEKVQPQKDPLFVPKLFWTFFISGVLSSWLYLTQMGNMNERSSKGEKSHKKVSFLFQNQTDKKTEHENDAQKKIKTGLTEGEINKNGLLNDVSLVEDGFNSSDVIDSLRTWLSVGLAMVNNKPSENQASDTKQTENHNINQSKPGHDIRQGSSLRRIRKMAPRKSSCRRSSGCFRHRAKHKFPNAKSRISRRFVKRINSLENFVFHQNNERKTSKHATGRLNYLYDLPVMGSQLQVMMLPFNHPNGPAKSNEVLGASAGRPGDEERPPGIFNGQMSVFEQITTGTVTESMKFEWARFKSFWSFPMTCPISPTMLAKYGFYFTGNEDKVCCFCCGVIHGGWQKGQSVYATHYQISRRCRFMNGDDVGNIPIHGPFSSLSRRGGGEDDQLTPQELELTSRLHTPDSITSVLLGREPDPGNPAATASLLAALPTAPNVRSEMRNGLEPGPGGTSNNPISQPQATRSSSVSQAPPPVTPVSTANRTPVVSQTSQPQSLQQVSTAPQTSTVSQPASLNQRMSQAHNDSLANQQRPLNQQQPTTFAQRQQQRHQEQQQLLGTGSGAANNPNQPGVTTAKPRYPNYAVLTVRSSTFNGFPNHLDQTPIQMARAGFFYAGYGDYVRCFFCGGGLRNWEPGDDPWVEHARWFPRCAYVKQNKGQTFINLVLQRQRELTLPNEYINTTTGASIATPNTATTAQTARTTDTPSSARDNTPVTATGQNTTASQRQASPTNTQRQSRPPPTVTDEEMKSPAVLSIKEMGYSDDVIKTAIQKIRRNQGPIRISAEILVETIFGFSDEDFFPQRNDQTQAGSANTSATPRETANTNSPSNESNTLEPQAGATSRPDPKPLRRLRDGDSSRKYTEEELKSIQEENDQLKDQMKCKICMENVVCISFLPCGHLCCCAECAPAMVKCPICRQIIKGSVKTYLS